ncbi:MAG: hypothetical protein ACYCTL_12440 [Acidimicrobiales bacterium]
MSASLSGQMQRMLVAYCPGLTDEGEDGRTMRAFEMVVTAAEAFCPWVEQVRPGLLGMPARGPARYFGGEQELATKVGTALAQVMARIRTTGAPDSTAITSVAEVGIGIANGLFAATLAARYAVTRPGDARVVVPETQTIAFLATAPISVLGHPELSDLLPRLGILTLGDFASIASCDVLARFGLDGAACHRVACGISGELPSLRRPPAVIRPPVTQGNQEGFWHEDAHSAKAIHALSKLQQMLGHEAVLIARLQEGRSPGEQSRLIPWSTATGPHTSQRTGPHTSQRTGPQAGTDPPWPGRIPPPPPAVVPAQPSPATLVDSAARPVGVSGRGLLTATPALLQVSGAPWQEVTWSAGPWPTEERWWSSTRRRIARLQVLTSTGGAHLLSIEQGRWWLEATYD